MVRAQAVLSLDSLYPAYCSIVFRVECLLLPGIYIQSIKAEIEEQGLPHPNLKFVFHGAQLMSRDYKEDNSKKLGGKPYVSAN